MKHQQRPNLWRMVCVNFTLTMKTLPIRYRFVQGLGWMGTLEESLEDM